MKKKVSENKPLMDLAMNYKWMKALTKGPYRFL